MMSGTSTPVGEPTRLTRHLVALVRDRAGAARAEFRVGLRSVPSLADHGFQDMVVLPGAFYVAMARCVEQELEGGREAARVLQSVVFHHPIILSSDDTVIQVDVSEHDGRVDYAFAEAAGKGPAATLSCSRPPAALSAGAALIPPQGTPASLEAAELYRQLRENANQYGPAFQRVTGVWRTAEDQCIGRLAVEPTSHEPVVLDAATQLLASLTIA